MKMLLRLFTLVAVMSLVFACGASQGTAANKAEKRPMYANLNNLSDALRMQSGLRVEGSGNGTKVYIRGTSTITLSTQPLYVINGNPIGQSYAMAANAVNVNDIVSIRVLKSSSQTTIYGEEGTNGVILIKTKVAEGN